MRLSHTGVESVRLTLPGLKQVAEAARIAATKILHNLARSVAGVVVNHKNFPIDAVGKS
jgi:hypothetical protein